MLLNASTRVFSVQWPNWHLFHHSFTPSTYTEAISFNETIGYLFNFFYFTCIRFVRLGETVANGGGEMDPIKKREHCGICEEEKEKGIQLYRLFICDECEHNMIHTEPREEKYTYYLKKLKNINTTTLYS